MVSQQMTWVRRTSKVPEHEGEAVHQTRFWRIERRQSQQLDLRRMADEVIVGVAWLLCCRPLTGLGVGIASVPMEYVEMSASACSETKGLAENGL
jgi:hypothetical protein